MPKQNNPTWQDVVPVELLTVTKEYLNFFCDQIGSIQELFSTAEDRKLLRDWDYHSWIEYYKTVPDIIPDVGSTILGLDIKRLPEEQLARTRIFLQTLKDFVENNKSLDSVNKISMSVEEIVQPKLLPYKLGLLAMFNDIACRIMYCTTVSDLIEEIRTGNDNAIIRLLSVDLIFIELPEVRNRVREATVFCDNVFLKKFGYVVGKSSVREKLSTRRDDIFLIMAWALGFQHTGVEQFGYFLLEVDFTRFRETSSLQKKLIRLGIFTKKIKKDTNLK